MRRIVSVLLLSSLLWQSAAHAQSRGGSSSYDQAIQLGLEEFRMGNYAEARARFLQALELDENARVLRALGKVEYELNHYRASAGYLERALASQSQPLTDEQRADVEQILKQARGYIGRYRLLTRPAEVSVRVDGQTAQLDNGELALEIGDHTLEVDAVGYRSWHQVLDVRGNSEQVLSVQLVADAQASSVAAHDASQHDAQPQPAAQPLKKKWWFWTTLGLVVAGGVVAGVVLSQREPEVAEAKGGSTGLVIPVGSRQ